MLNQIFTWQTSVKNWLLRVPQNKIHISWHIRWPEVTSLPFFSTKLVQEGLRPYHPAYTTRLDKPQLMLNCRTVTTTVCTTPRNDGSICHNRRKGPPCGLNVLDTPELILNCGTVCTIVCISPGHDRSIFQNRSKGPPCGLNVLHTLERTVSTKA